MIKRGGSQMAALFYIIVWLSTLVIFWYEDGSPGEQRSSYD